MNNEAEKIIQITANYRSEAKEARKDRLDLNKRNWDVYHLRGDFSHKQEGQSREFLAKQSMAVEQIVTFFQQALIDTSGWFTVESAPGVEAPMFSDKEAELILARHLIKTDAINHVGDLLKLGLLGSLMITKVTGKYVKKPEYYTMDKMNSQMQRVKELRRKDTMVWQLSLELVRHEDYYPDPIVRPGGKPLYEGQDIHMDLHEVRKLTQGPHALYDAAEVEKMAAKMGEEEDQKTKRARETGQNTTFSNYRNRVKLSEFWGDIVDETGNILHENVTWTIANDLYLIAPPKKNPFWHGESPFVVTPIIRVPFSSWHKALMDAPTAHNLAANELYNLILDGGIMTTHGIKQVRPDWLEDPTEVENGVGPGATLKANTNCPPGAKVLERVDTAAVSSESLAVYQLINAEFNQSSLTNDLRMGVLPSRAVKATEVVEASQTITSIFTGMTKVIEATHLAEGVLRKGFLTIMQNMNDMDSAELRDLLGKDRAIALAQVTPEERFAQTASGCKFSASGVSGVLSKMKDFKKLTALLQTVFGNELLAQEFLKQYSPGKFLDLIIRSLDIDTNKIKIPEAEKIAAMAANPAVAGQVGGGMGGPEMQSQIPQAGSEVNNPAERAESLIPRTNFPRTSGGVQT
jgi:hypothetical protein